MQCPGLIDDFGSVLLPRGRAWLFLDSIARGGFNREFDSPSLVEKYLDSLFHLRGLQAERGLSRGVGDAATPTSVRESTTIFPVLPLPRSSETPEERAHFRGSSALLYADHEATLMSRGVYSESAWEHRALRQSVQTTRSPVELST